MTIGPIWERIKSWLADVRDSPHATLGFVSVLVVAAAIVLAIAHFTRGEKHVLKNSYPVTSTRCSQGLAELRELQAKLVPYGVTGVYTNEQLAVAGHYLDAYSQLKNRCPASLPVDHFYDDVKIKYETTKASVIALTLDAEERAGIDALKRNNYEVARASFSRALSLIRQINTNYPSSSQSDISRETVIKRRLYEATYKPTLANYEKLLARADTAFSNGDYETARNAYAELMREIDQVAATVPPDYMSFNEPKFTAEHRLVESAARIAARDLEEAQKKAHAAVASRDWDNAEALYARAIDLQKKVAQNFPLSSYADASLARQLENDRDVDLSGKYLARLDDLSNDISRAIQTKDRPALHAALKSVSDNISEVTLKYPLANVAHKEVVERLQFLASHEAVILSINEEVIPRFIQIPGNSEWRMLDREIWQKLYYALMGANPSARKAEMLPVEGVTMVEARTFATRLSWVLAREVKVPMLDSYLALIQSPDRNFIGKDVWNSVTATNREPQPVATSKADSHGYYDLYGNVAEWAELTFTSGSTVVAFGGSARDNPVRLMETPQENHKEDERVRNVGFRVMIKNDTQTSDARRQ
jgi:tetratricopeptide (TPR) repeat protein